MSEPTEPVELTTALIAGLAVQANQLTVAAGHLRDTYRFSRQLKVVVAIGVVVILGMGVMLALLLNLAAANHATGTSIKDCTTPAGKCYQRGESTTTAAVEQIVAGVNAHTDMVLIATLECSRRPLSDRAFVACLHAKGIRW